MAESDDGDRKKRGSSEEERGRVGADGEAKQRELDDAVRGHRKSQTNEQGQSEGLEHTSENGHESDRNHCAASVAMECAEELDRGLEAGGARVLGIRSDHYNYSTPV